MKPCRRPTFPRLTALFAAVAFTPEEHQHLLLGRRRRFQGHLVPGRQRESNSHGSLYHLIGTVWMTNNTCLSHSNAGAQSAVGSVTLANSTAETFIQSPKNQPLSSVLNCFTCHNDTSYNFQNPPPKKLPARAVALSHVLGVGTAYAVSNLVTGKIVTPSK